MLSKATIILTFYCLIFQISSSINQNEKIEFYNVSKKTDLVFFFKKETTKEQRQYFHENILMKKSDEGDYWSRDGVRTYFGLEKEGYKGGGINFFPNATQKQKKDIRERIKKSSYIYKIYENVVPNNIKVL